MPKHPFTLRFTSYSAGETPALPIITAALECNDFGANSEDWMRNSETRAFFAFYC